MDTLKVIATMQSAFPEKFGIPRQSNMVDGLKSRIVFEPEYRNMDALRGLEHISHIWLIWAFSESKRQGWSPTIRPPRLGGNKRIGVFASRSPFRPNSLGLSSVKIDYIQQHPVLGPVIHVLGADLMNGTPIYDIKPFIPYTDNHPDATGGFADKPPGEVLQVVLPDKLSHGMDTEAMETLRRILAYDPRPSYQKDPERIYGMSFGGIEVKFKVAGDILTVTDIIKGDNSP